MSDFRQDFLKFSLQQDVLRFGEFITKAGRKSPYFFNAGLFSDGIGILHLAQYYAEAIIASKVEFDMLFGPAYKGIILAATTSLALAQKGINKPFAYNRKEAKDHGEGGNLVGAPLQGKVLIIDDVISAGTSVRESMKLIQQENASAAGVVIALDRMEKGQGDLSAVEETKRQHQIPVIAIATLKDLLDLLKHDAQLAEFLPQVEAYRNTYGTH